MKNKKDLIIINGVTGAIGSACLAHFASQKDTVVYGLTRKGRWYYYGVPDGKKLPLATLFYSLTGVDPLTQRSVGGFARLIDKTKFKSIRYIHCIGHYPFEVIKSGKYVVRRDNDGDGVDDRCQELTFRYFTLLYEALSKIGLNQAFIFGSIADKHRPLVHKSWWLTMDKLKQAIAFKQSNDQTLPPVVVVNISSVLCPKEIVERPFVFTNTNANPAYWLQPHEIALFVHKLFRVNKQRLYEVDLFKKVPNFNTTYYKNSNFTTRKVKELFGKI